MVTFDQDLATLEAYVAADPSPDLVSWPWQYFLLYQPNSLDADWVRTGALRDTAAPGSVGAAEIGAFDNEGMTGDLTAFEFVEFLTSSANRPTYVFRMPAGWVVDDFNWASINLNPAPETPAPTNTGVLRVVDLSTTSIFQVGQKLRK